MFRSSIVPDSGLTFYRIWRFRVKHIETNMLFELCDWKAASSSTFSNGRPNISSFRDDAIELFQFVTHPHFIMHPVGLNPRVERLFFYTIRASAGGSVSANPIRHKRQTHSSKKRRHMEPVSPRVKAGHTFGNQLYEKPMFPDIEEKLERWRARRKAHLLQPPSPRPSPASSNAINPFDNLSNMTTPLSRASSVSSNLSATSSHNSTLQLSESETETDSQMECCNTASSDTSDSSEFEFYENGYVTNCEYFISNTDSFDSIEEQHSMQASIADLWQLNNGSSEAGTTQPQEKVHIIKCDYCEKLFSLPCKHTTLY